MHLLGIAVVGLEIQLAVGALGFQDPSIDLATQALTVVMGVLFLIALVLPSFVRVFLSRHEDAAFRRAVGELVAAGDSRDVAEHLLPHVCALVGASWAALLADDGTVVARYPVWTEDDGPDPWDSDSSKNGQRRITVQTRSGASHSLAVKISPSMPYFGSEELHKLDQLAGMVGLAIERCEMAEQIAFQASHDGLTGLANRTMFMERLEEALSHVGRRRAASGGALHRPRPLQAGERPGGSFGRRPGPQRDGRPADGDDAGWTWWRASAATSSWPSPRSTIKRMRSTWPNASGPD